MEKKILHVKAKVLSPFHYNHLPIAGGSSTLPHVITDTSIMFALANALGNINQGLLLKGNPNYKQDIKNLPIKSSLFKRNPVDGIPELMEPLAQRFSITDEYYSFTDFKRNNKLSASGMFKEFFFIQQIPYGAEYTGTLYGVDPFELLGCSEIIVRIGINRSGIIMLKKTESNDIRLNAYTANMMTGNQFKVENIWLGRIYETYSINEHDFIQEVSLWN